MPDLAITEVGKLSAPDLKAKLHQAAKSFEEQFTAQLLKPMKDASEDEENLFGSDPGNAMFKGMMIDGLAEHAAGQLGVAKIIEDAMTRRLQKK
ncbi:MAG: rod-binding protein [Planctomycetota bacterium]